MNNPRFDLLLSFYHQYDAMTLMLAGVAGFSVVVGFLFRKSVVFQVFFLFTWVAVLAGSTYILLGG
jgi:hypothetical protein